MSSLTPRLVILCGGPSAEREVSLRTGAAMAAVLREGRPDLRLVELPGGQLPDDLDPATEFVFPALHGTWGEDGQLQALLDARGITYAGCDATASALCMDKAATKARAAAAGVIVAAGLHARHDQLPTAETIVGLCGPSVVIKPQNEGSSVGLQFADGVGEVAAALARLTPGAWLFERRLRGRELTVGLLDGHAMAVVEIRPTAGVYDYRHKYTAGMTTYLCPAPLDAALTHRVQQSAETVFRACGCRDFARSDFILEPDGSPYFLEINTLPGLTATSLLPKSAAAVGLDFGRLAERLIAPALSRFHRQSRPAAAGRSSIVFG